MDSLNCNFDPAFLLVFSDNVFSSLIYYSHFGPLTVSLLLGLLVLLNNKRSLINISFFTVTVFFSIWVLFDLVLWASENPSFIMFFWASMIHIEMLIFASCLYMILVFTNVGSDISDVNKIAILLPFIPLIIFAHTDYNLLGYDASNCDRAAIEGPLWQYVYLMELFYILWVAIVVVKGVLKARTTEEKGRITLVGSGLLLFMTIFSAGNITLIFSLDWSYEQYKLFGMPIFLAILTYAIVRFKAFNPKLIMAQALVGSLAVLVLSLLFIQNIRDVRVIGSITFLFVSVIGIILVRNVRNEIRQRERIEKLAKDLESANQRLRELDREKTEFVSIASHQLRAPITAIKGYSSLLLEKSYGEIPEKMEQPITNIFESSRLMVNTIEDFLNVSRIELGRMNFAMEDFDLIGISRKVVEELTNNAKLKDLALNFSTREGSVMVHADLNKIKQVVTNFVDNAIKYTQKGSIEVIVSADRVKNKALIAVKDTGMGLDKSTIDELFDKFTRARNANQVNTTGTGLGLYVGKQLIQGHSGRVWVESEGQGKGSTFFIELPLKKNTESGI